MRFAKSVNFADEEFAGNASGIAMKLKMMALENKCITMERKFTSSLRYQFKVLFSAWAKRKGFAKEDYLKVFFGFKRNLPANILDEAQSTFVTPYFSLFASPIIRHMRWRRCLNV